MTAQPQPSNKKANIATVAVLALAIPFIAKWEGKRNETYLDVVGVPTVCYGQTGKKATIGMVFSDRECLAMLGDTAYKYALELDKCVTAPVTPYQGASILELAYNVGTPAVCKSRLVRELNAGVAPPIWCKRLRDWVHARGRLYKGLVNRRTDSYNMCITTEQQ